MEKATKKAKISKKVLIAEIEKMGVDTKITQSLGRANIETIVWVKSLIKAQNPTKVNQNPSLLGFFFVPKINRADFITEPHACQELFSAIYANFSKPISLPPETTANPVKTSIRAKRSERAKVV